MANRKHGKCFLSAVFAAIDDGHHIVRHWDHTQQWFQIQGTQHLIQGTQHLIGNLLGRADLTQSSPLSESYTYDTLNRLIASASSGGGIVGTLSKSLS